MTDPGSLREISRHRSRDKETHLLINPDQPARNGGMAMMISKRGYPGRAASVAMHHGTSDRNTAQPDVGLSDLVSSQQ